MLPIAIGFISLDADTGHLDSVFEQSETAVFFCNAVGLPFGVLQFIPPFAFLFSIFFCNASPLSFGSELYMYFVFRVVFAAFSYIEMGYHWKGEAFFCGLL